MINKKWINSSDNFIFSDIPEVTDKLPSGVYELQLSKEGFFLSKISPSFELPSKIYDSEKELIDRVKKSFNGFNKNFGILLKGLKGTGKTVTAKQICNELNLPVILVNQYYPNIGNFINGIEQDVILLFDEFEKVYEISFYSRDDDDEQEGKTKKSVSNLLTLMDGVFTSEYKRLFILTTNQEYMPDAIVSRPSRIRYIKDFTDLSYDGILKILNDIVENKELIPPLMSLMKDLKIITVDIVKSIAEEANMYNTADSEFFSIFNVKRTDEFSDILQIMSDGKEQVVYERTKLNIYQLYKNYTLYIGDEVYRVIDNNTDKGIFTAKLQNPTGKTAIVNTYKFRKAVSIHKSFSENLLF